MFQSHKNTKNNKTTSDHVVRLCESSDVHD